MTLLCRKITLLLLSVALSLWMPLVFGQEQSFLYRWKDDKGVIHITDRLDKIPARYRSRAEKIEQGVSGKEETEESKGASSEIYSPTDSYETEEDVIKAEWQQRMFDARRRLADAEVRLADLEQQKKTLQQSYGSGVAIVQTPKGPVAVGAPAAPQDVLDKMRDLDRDIEMARAQVDAARREVEVTIPDEARKAGILPGWLRE